MEKLGQLRRSDDWDLIVVDTPPSRSALDFLDAPARLGRFLDGRFIRLLMAPAKVGGRAYMKVFSVGVNVFTQAMTKILGAQVLKDAQTFVSALETVFGDFRQRADQTYKLLQTPGTAFLVVAAPEHDALREASYFVERLDDERMPLAGLVLNRVHSTRAADVSDARSIAAAEALEETKSHPLVASALRLHAERMRVAERESRLRGQFTSAHPSVPVVEVPAQPQDVHDLDGLRRIGDELANLTRPTEPAG